MDCRQHPCDGCCKFCCSRRWQDGVSGLFGSASGQFSVTFPRAHVNLGPCGTAIPQGDAEGVRALRAKWLKTDIRQTGEPVLPHIDPENALHRLARSLAVQMDYVINVSDSGHSQLEALEREAAPPTGRQHAPGKANHRTPSASGKVLKLRLTDGHRDLQAMTLKPVPGLTVTTKPGTKVVLKAGTQVVKGVVLLTPATVTVLGGCSVALQASNNNVCILKRWLGVESAGDGDASGGGEPTAVRSVNGGAGEVPEIDSEDEKEFALAAYALEDAGNELSTPRLAAEERRTPLSGSRGDTGEASAPSHPASAATGPATGSRISSGGNPYGRFAAPVAARTAASTSSARPSASLGPKERQTPAPAKVNPAGPTATAMAKPKVSPPVRNAATLAAPGGPAKPTVKEEGQRYPSHAKRRLVAGCVVGFGKINVDKENQWQLSVTLRDEAGTETQAPFSNTVSHQQRPPMYLCFFPGRLDCLTWVSSFLSWCQGSSAWMRSSFGYVPGSWLASPCCPRVGDRRTPPRCLAAPGAVMISQETLLLL